MGDFRNEHKPLLQVTINIEGNESAPGAVFISDTSAIVPITFSVRLQNTNDDEKLGLFTMVRMACWTGRELN